MNLSKAYSEIKNIRIPVFRTADLAAKLGISPSHASHVLDRLTKNGLLAHVSRGVWMLSELADPLLLVAQLTAPHPAYLSLHTALYHHGMISQMPQAISVISLGKSRRIDTPQGRFLIHHISSNFFLGFEPLNNNQVSMAIPEKALLDVLYLGLNNSKRFCSLPEIELPKGFSKKRCSELINRIPSKSRRGRISDRLETILDNVV